MWNIDTATQPSNTRLSGGDKILVAIDLFFTAELSKLVAQAGYKRRFGRSAVRLPAVVLKPLQKLSYRLACPMQLRLTGPYRASKNLGDLVMSVTLQIVENLRRFVASR